MSGRIGAFHFDPKSDEVWKVLAQVGTIGRYSDVARALVMGWVNNAWAYAEDGTPGELDTEILQQVEHLRQGAANGGPSVHPFVNCEDGLMYGVHLTSNEPGLEVRVTGLSDMKEPVLSMVFAPRYDQRRVVAFARALRFELPDLNAPDLVSHSTESTSQDATIGRVEINVVSNAVVVE